MIRAIFLQETVKRLISTKIRILKIIMKIVTITGNVIIIIILWRSKIFLIRTFKNTRENLNFWPTTLEQQLVVTTFKVINFVLTNNDNFWILFELFWNFWLFRNFKKCSCKFFQTLCLLTGLVLFRVVFLKYQWFLLLILKFLHFQQLLLFRSFFCKRKILLNSYCCNVVYYNCFLDRKLELHPSLLLFFLFSATVCIIKYVICFSSLFCVSGKTHQYWGHLWVLASQSLALSSVAFGYADTIVLFLWSRLRHFTDTFTACAHCHTDSHTLVSGTTCHQKPQTIFILCYFVNW